VLALGFTLIWAGLLTSASVSVLGALLAVVGCVGWFGEVLPRQHEVPLRVREEDFSAFTIRSAIDRLPIAPEQVRAWLPFHTHPVAAGVRGGLAGGAAMAALACLYGLIKPGSIWNPINLLAASVYAQTVKLETSQLNAFHLDAFAIAVVLHALISVAVGLLYGAMLPMFPRRPIVLGGLLGPVLWSGLVYSILSLLNPLLESHIDWLWFMASQIAFGVVAGVVVLQHERVPTRENVAFALRAGVEAPGIIAPRRTGEER
jgi:hypothetical protein